MEKLIACCGLNCKECEARKATLNNDNNLRIEVAKKWSKWNKIEIKPESINCVGCTTDGLKFGYCMMCPIRKCSYENHYKNCGECPKMESCGKLKMITDNNKEALANLKDKNNHK